ncbi:MAG: PIN domain-containing protein [Chloracidobacterium sp.]|nr:PIN domain-containing protein [Chloracidobacterium sp.]
MRIYIDTSVVGGVFDEEFAKATQAFFAQVEDGDLTLVLSELLYVELERAPEHVRTYLDKFDDSQVEMVNTTAEAVDLAAMYVDEKVVGATSMADCQHIAIATIQRVDVLVSWNFKHIVNLARIRGYNSINLRSGYPMLEIRTPLEVLEQ